MLKSIESNCTSYLDAWSRKDLDGIAIHLHPDAHFKGPMQAQRTRGHIGVLQTHGVRRSCNVCL
jgi:hypothetical protein